MITINAYSAYGKRSDTLESATLVESSPELFRFFTGPSQKIEMERKEK
jgi:hypothetical protein